MPEFTRRTQIFQQVHCYLSPFFEYTLNAEADHLRVAINSDFDLRLHKTSRASLL